MRYLPASEITKHHFDNHWKWWRSLSPAALSLLYLLSATPDSHGFSANDPPVFGRAETRNLYPNGSSWVEVNFPQKPSAKIFYRFCSSSECANNKIVKPKETVYATLLVESRGNVQCGFIAVRANFVNSSGIAILDGIDTGFLGAGGKIMMSLGMDKYGVPPLEWSSLDSLRFTCAFK